MRKLIILIFLLLPFAVSAQENLESFDDKNTPVLNDDLQDSFRRIRKLQDKTSFIDSTEIIPLANGGFGTALTDPDADRVPFWDDSTSGFIWKSLSNIELITADDASWDVPSWVSTVYVSCVGGGAGAGGGASSHGGGGGGSAGNYIINYPVTVTPGGTVAITIGEGGAGGTGIGDGIDGENTVFGSITIPGGNKGLGSSQTGGTADIGLDGSGQTAGGGSNYLPGGNGADGTSVGGKGGGSPWGIGGNGGASAGGGGGDAGDNATGYGAGGGGADSNGGESDSTGGNGSDGMCIIKY